MTITNRSGWLGIALACVLEAACGGGQKSDGVKTQQLTDQPPVVYEDAPAESGGQTADAPALEPHLEFAEMTLFEGSKPVLKIHADGSTELPKRLSDPGAAQSGEAQWEAGPLVKADGTIIFKEQQVARVNPDGTITNLRTNEKLPVTYSASEVVSTGGGKQVGLSLAEDGNMTLTGDVPAEAAGKAVMKLEGAQSEAHRKTALAVVGALFMAKESSSQASGQ